MAEPLKTNRESYNDGFQDAVTGVCVWFFLAAAVWLTIEYVLSY